MNRRIITVFIILCLCISAVMPAFAASDTAKLAADDVQTAEGEEFDIEIYLENPLMAAGGGLNLVYDSEYIMPLSYIKGAAFGSIAPNVNLTYGANTIRMNWMSAYTLTEGKLITFSFKALKEGSCEVSIENAELYTVGIAQIGVETSGGTVTIAEGTAPSPLPELTLLDDDGTVPMRFDNGLYTAVAALDAGGVPYDLYICMYGESGELVSVKYIKVSAADGTQTQERISVGSEVESVALFAWTDKMCPLTGKYSISRLQE